MSYQSEHVPSENERLYSFTSTNQRRTGINDFSSLSTKIINDTFSKGLTKPDIFSTLPPMDMTQDEHRVHISLDIPGCSIRDISLSLTHGTLLVKASKSREILRDNTIFYTNERKATSIYRYIRLPSRTNLSRISSTYRDGVLFIQAPLLKDNNISRDITIFQG